MIVKQVDKKIPKGSFKGLADYILDRTHDGAKVEEYEFTNCPFDTVEDNFLFIRETQKDSRSEQNKTMHIVVSFPEGEKPSKEVLQDIEKELMRTLGMEEHQRLSVTHTNTNNFHMHIAINKIHPVTKHIINPHKSKIKINNKAAELEVKHKLQKTNHLSNDLRKEAGIIFEDIQYNKSKEIEIHSGVDSLLTWIKEEALEDIKEVLKDPKSSLDILHQVLADYNLELKPRGNGIVIADKTRKLFVKASDVHRDLSKGKLEKRFGEFKTSKITTTPKKKFGRPVNEYWKRYQELSTQKRSTKTEE